MAAKKSRALMTHGVQGSMPVNLKRSRLRPRQYSSPVGMIFAFLAALAVIGAIAYTVLVVTKVMPVPAAVMFGDTSASGKVLTTATNQGQLVSYEAAEFSDPAVGQTYLDFKNTLLAAMQPAYDAYGNLALELSRGGIPNNERLSQLAQEARTQGQLSRDTIRTISIPSDLDSDVVNLLTKVVDSCNKFLDFGDEVVNSVLAGTQGSISAYGEATNSATNMNRHNTAVITNLKSVESLLGAKKAEAPVAEGAEAQPPVEPTETN